MYTTSVMALAFVFSTMITQSSATTIDSDSGQSRFRWLVNSGQMQSTLIAEDQRVGRQTQQANQPNTRNEDPGECPAGARIVEQMVLSATTSNLGRYCVIEQPDGAIRKHGPAVLFVDRGPEKWCQGEFTNGLREGLWISWFRNGERQAYGGYKAGKAHGHWVWFFGLTPQWRVKLGRDEQTIRLAEGDFEEGKVVPGSFVSYSDDVEPFIKAGLLPLFINMELFARVPFDVCAEFR